MGFPNPIALSDPDLCPSACDPGEAWIKGSAIQAGAVTRLSGERSDLDGGVQEAGGSSPPSSMPGKTAWVCGNENSESVRGYSARRDRVHMVGRHGLVRGGRCRDRSRVNPWNRPKVHFETVDYALRSLTDDAQVSGVATG